MTDESKTTEQLVAELAEMRQRVAEVEGMELRRKRAEERIEHLNAVLRALQKVNRLITKEKDRNRLIQGVCDLLIETRGYFNAWIALLDEADHLRTAVEAGLGDAFRPMMERLEAGELTSCGKKALSQADACAVEDPLFTCRDCPLAKTYGGRGAMTTRLEHGGRVCGILCVSVPARFIADEEEQSLFKEVAADIAFALHSIEVEKERKEAEEALAESERKYRELVQNANSIIIRVDPEGKITFFNEFAEEFFGYKAEEIVGRNAIGTILPEVDSNGKDMPSLVTEVFSRPEDYATHENENMRKSGERVWVAWTNKAVRDEEGRIREFLCVGNDVTALRRAEAKARLQQEQLMQADKMVALGTLVSGVGHEINNPTNYIMLNIPLLKGAWESAFPVLEEYYRGHGDFRLRGIPYSEARQMVPQLLDDILEGGRRIKQIVGELKNYVRPLETRFDEGVEVNKVVQSAITLTNNFVYRRTQSFFVEYDEDLPKIRGSAQRIEQVVVNLIQNACEALENSQQAVSVRTSYDEDQEWVVITVRDEGSGIPEEHLRHVTDPFFTTKRDEGGTGLGLSISDRIVKDHGGMLRFKSTLGEGTVATVFLPVSRQ
jgi:PAS domain S-box-containing protein